MNVPTFLRPDDKPIDFTKATRRVFGALRWVVAFAVCAIALYLQDLVNIGLAIVVAAASLVVGAFLGFLFGIPRSLTRENEAAGYAPNTNLEQVSDWLTKIIIGVSLVEFQGILQRLDLTVGVLQESFQRVYVPYAFVWALVVFFAFFGFIGAYLYTRVFLPTIFKMADSGAMDEKKAEEIAKKVVLTIADQNAEATRLAEFQLSTGPVVVNVEKAELTKAIHAATQNVKSEIYFKARKFRMDREHGTEEQRDEMVRALPVFDALIADDEALNEEPMFHSNYAQRGFIFLRLPEPDFENAKRALDKAIEVRDRTKDKDHKHYELCRALARIGSWKYRHVEGEEFHAAIAADLKEAFRNAKNIAIDAEERSWIKEWMDARNVTDIKLPDASKVIVLPPQ